MTERTNNTGIRRYVGWGAGLLVALLVTGYITNDQFADLLSRLIPFGLLSPT